NLAPQESLLSEYDILLRLFTRTRDLLALAGITGRKFNLSQVMSSAKDTRKVARMFLDENSGDIVSFETDKVDGFEDDFLKNQQECLFVDYLQIGEIVLAYSITATMTVKLLPDGIGWQGTDMRPREICNVPNFPDGYDSIVQEFKSKWPATLLTL